MRAAEGSVPAGVDLAADVGALRSELGLEPGCLAVNAGSWGPLCRAAVDAMADFEQRARAGRTDWESFAPAALELLAADRAAVAAMIGARPQEIALCESTTQALNVVLWGLDLRAGEEIVASTLENPAADIALWTVAQRRGVRVVRAEIVPGEGDVAAAFAAKTTPRTRLFLASDVEYATGTRLDLASLAELAAEHGVFLLADGVQALGAVPVDVAALGVDAYAVARHKFACGPDGAGALYVREVALERVAPTFAGVCSTSLYSASPPPPGTFEYRATAERFEVSTRAFGAYAGGRAALEWLARDIGLPVVHERTAALRRSLWDALAAVPAVEPVSARDQEGGLLALRVAGVPPAELVRRLRGRGVHTRTIDATGSPCVRLSVGFWNCAADVVAIADAVRAVAAPRWQCTGRGGRARECGRIRCGPPTARA